MPADLNPLALLNYFKWAVILYALVYLLMVFGLSLLAARVRQRSAWLAWFPVLNYYLMCRLANASLLLILPALIPILNCLVFAYLGAGMAKRVGRSGFLGALFGVPVLGNLVPLLLGAGSLTAAEQAEAPPIRPPLVTALIHAGVAFCLVVLTGAGFMAASRMSRTAVATVEQATASLPARLTGTLTEFPIDTAVDHPARPTQVVTETYEQPGAVEAVSTGQISTRQLPPWIASSALPALAENATAAEYVTGGSTAKVNIVTLALRDSHNRELALPTQEQLQAIAPDATVTGLELSTPDNITYRGFRVSTAVAVYYALRRGDTNTAILISAKEGSRHGCGRAPGPQRRQRPGSFEGRAIPRLVQPAAVAASGHQPADDQDFHRGRYRRSGHPDGCRGGPRRRPGSGGGQTGGPGHPAGPGRGAAFLLDRGLCDHRRITGWLRGWYRRHEASRRQPGV
jgi:hypothetical protein